MKKIIFLSIFSFTILFFAACATGTAKQDAEDSNMEMESLTDTLSMKTNIHDYYTCTMHPRIIKDIPGKCPKCGKDFVKDRQIRHIARVIWVRTVYSTEYSFIIKST